MITYTAEQAINQAAADVGRYVPGEALGAPEHEILSMALDKVLAEVSKIIAINDRDIEERLGLDGVQEGVIAMAGCGPATAEPSPLDMEFGSRPPDT